MDNVITEYQKWKEQGETLRTKAKLAMESRFRDILTEAVEIAHLYRQDFGAPLKPPTIVTAFKFKTNVKPKSKKPAAKPAKAEKQEAPKADAKTDSPQLTAMRKRLDQTRKKLEAARAAGQNTKNLDDKIYELEDTIRLAEIA